MCPFLERFFNLGGPRGTQLKKLQNLDPFGYISILTPQLFDLLLGIKVQVYERKMLRILKADKVNQIFTLEIGQKDLRNVIEAVDNMVEKQQKTLLENLPSEDQVRQKLDDYKALKEELRKIWETLVQ